MEGKFTLGVFVLFALVQSAAAQPAAPGAEDPGMATRLTMRPLTLPEGTWLVGGSGRLRYGMGAPPRWREMSLRTEVALGVVDAFEIMMTPVRVRSGASDGAFEERWRDPTIRLATSFDLTSSWQIGGALTASLPLADDGVDFTTVLELNALYRSRRVSIGLAAYGAIAWNYGFLTGPANTYLGGLSVSARAQLSRLLSVRVFGDPSLWVLSGFGGSELATQLVIGGSFALTVPRPEDSTPWADIQLTLSAPIYQSTMFVGSEIRIALGGWIYVDLF